MDRFEKRLEQAAKAVAALVELTQLARPTVVERDALLLRFMLATEAIWKASQRFLSQQHELEIGSPREAVRAGLAVRLLDAEEAEKALVLLRDRNLIVHTYDEDLAREVVSRIPGHARVLQSWLGALQRR